MRMIQKVVLGFLALITVVVLSILATPTGRAYAQALSGSIGFRSTGHVLLSQTAPTVTSAGTSPSVTASNGAATFIVNVGTGGSATAIVMAMPAAFAGWTCQANDITAAAASVAAQADHQTASTTTSVTMTHYTVSTGAVLAYTASDLVRFSCVAY